MHVVATSATGDTAIGSTLPFRTGRLPDDVIQFSAFSTAPLSLVTRWSPRRHRWASARAPPDRRQLRARGLVSTHGGSRRLPAAAERSLHRRYFRPCHPTAPACDRLRRMGSPRKRRPHLDHPGVHHRLHEIRLLDGATKPCSWRSSRIPSISGSSAVPRTGSGRQWPSASHASGGRPLRMEQLRPLPFERSPRLLVAVSRRQGRPHPRQCGRGGRGRELPTEHASLQRDHPDRCRQRARSSGGWARAKPTSSGSSAIRKTDSTCRTRPGA